jgi:transposase
MRDISTNFEDVVINMLDTLDPPLRKRVLNNRLCFKSIVKCLDTGINWRELPFLMKLECSWSTIYKRFSKWVNDGILAAIWQHLVIIYHDKKSKDVNWFKDIFIDSTHVRNIQGHDLTGQNHMDRNRMSTKVSIICDKSGIPLSCQMYPSNVHDSMTTEQAVNNLPFDLKRLDGRRRTYLIGDKGYISEQTKQNLASKNIKLLTPYRRNQRLHRIHLSIRNTTRLKKRVVIEHVFNRLDAKRRLIIRYDHTYKSFLAFHHLAFMLMMKQVLANIL